MLRKLSLYFVLAIILSACQTAKPTSIPLSEVDLESILIQDGDLPSSFTLEQITYRPSVDISAINMPVAEQIIHREFLSEGLRNEGVTIWLFQDDVSLDESFNNLLSSYPMNKGEETPLDVGEKNILRVEKTEGVLSIFSSRIAFTRCGALVYIDMFNTRDITDVVTTYSQRLDRRLSSLICSE